MQRFCVFFITMAGIILLPQYAFCTFSLRDYFPTQQNDSWWYKETDTFPGGSETFTSKHNISGFEDVNYAGTFYRGFKLYEGEIDHIDYSVENLTNDNLLFIKNFEQKDGSYSLYGPLSGAPKLKPFSAVPTAVNIGSTYSTSYKEFLYNSSGSVIDTFAHDLNVTVASKKNTLKVEGGFFGDVLQVNLRNTINSRTTDYSADRNETLYFGRNVGLIKSDATLTERNSGATEVHTVSEELIKANIAGYNYGKPKYPILLVHGINESADDAWVKSGATGFFDAQGWKNGGVFNADISQDNLNQINIGSSINDSHGDYFLVNFSPDQDGITKQGKALGEIVRQVKNQTGSDKVIIVSHSMGGLAAREYMQNGSYQGDVDQLVTIGTPHKGSHEATDPIAVGLFNSTWGITNPINFFSDGMRDLREDSIYLNGGPESATLDIYNNDIDYDGPLTNIQGLLHKSFRSEPTYVSIVGELKNTGGDGVVSTSNQRLGIGKTIKIPYSVTHITETTATGSIYEALGYNPNYLFLKGGSPIDLSVTDPNGYAIDKIHSDIAGAYYFDFDLDADGTLDPLVMIPNPVPGEYLIRPLPREGTSPTDEYSLAMFYNGKYTTFANGLQLQDLPSDPYRFDTSAAVPEPSTVALFAMGLIAFIGRKRLRL